MQGVITTLDHILAAQGLKGPDGRPLYAYRCDEPTVVQLEVALRDCARQGSSLSVAERAAFCLYASWHFSRAHNEGAWTWETVVQPLGLNVPYVKLTSIVTTGLRWWKRSLDILHDRTQYMMTLACEGGLPHALLRREGAHVHGFFVSLLHDRERFRATPTENLVSRHEYKLPQSWRNEKIRAVSGALIDRVAEFRTLVGASPEPLTCLDQQRPGWRNELPMRVPDEVAVDLIKGLLGEPVPTAVGSYLRIRTFLRSGAERWTLLRQADSPPIVSAADLAGELGVDANVLPPTCGLHVTLVDGTTRRVATAQRLFGVDDPRYRIELDELALKGDDARTLGELGISAIAGGLELGRALPRGGEPIGELPWVFDIAADDDGRHEALAMGALRTRRSQVLVVIPESASIHAEPGSGELAELGRVRLASRDSTILQALAPGLGERTVWKLTGRAVIDLGDGDTVAVETATPEEQATEYRLVGARVALGQGGGEVWSGPPALEERSVGSTRHLSAQALEWRPIASRASFRPVDARCIGDVQLRFRNGLQTMFRSRATILPPGVAIQLKGELGRSGTVIIKGVHLAAVKAGLPPGVTMLQTIERTETRIALDSAGRPPPTVPLWLELGDGAQATLELPYPSADIQWVDAAGRILDDSPGLALEELLGSRVQVATPKAQVTFMLTGQLHGDRRPGSGDAEELETLHAQPRDLGALRVDAVGRHVLPLDQVYGQVRQLLAMSTDLDAYVALRVETVGGTVVSRRNQRAALLVRRYDAWFDRNVEHLEDGVRIRPDATALERLGTDTLADLRVDARRIGDVEGVVHALARNDDDRGPAFHLLNASCKPGPWLAIGWQGAHARFRPLLLNLTGRLPDAQPGSLGAASAISDKRTRRAELDCVIVRLAEDLDHPDWPEVRGVLAQLGQVPSTTYDLIDRLVRAPSAVALAALTVPAGQIRMLWDKLEELPFLWPLIPVRSWVQAIGVLRARDERLFSDDIQEFKEVFKDRLRKRLRLLADEGPWLHAIWDVAYQLVEDVPEPDASLVWNVRQGIMNMDGLVQVARDELRRRHAQDQYPRSTAELVLGRSRMPKVPDRFVYRARPEHEQDAQNAPLVAAYVSAFAVSVNRVEIFELAKLRDFDRAAFDQLYSFILTQLLGEALAATGAL